MNIDAIAEIFEPEIHLKKKVQYEFFEKFTKAQEEDVAENPHLPIFQGIREDDKEYMSALMTAYFVVRE